MKPKAAPKMVLVASILVAVSMLSGCGTAVKQAVNSLKINEVQAQGMEAQVLGTEKQAQGKEKNATIDKETIGYEITRAIAENKEINAIIYYPQISGYKGELLMGYMNQTLKKVTDRYGKGETYQDVKIDYTITKMDKDILSVLYKGTGKIAGGREINIQQSVNLDIKTSNAIEFNNLIKADQASGSAVRLLLNQKAKSMGKFGVEFERVRLYFEGDNVVFFYLPADDSVTNFIEISVPMKELEGFLSTDFGEKPAS